MTVSIAIVHYTLEGGGGSERMIFDLFRHLDPKLIRPVLFCLYDVGSLGAKLRDAGYPVHSGFMGGPTDLPGTRRMGRAMAAEACQLMYTPNSFMNIVAGRLASSSAGISENVVGFHSYDMLMRRFQPWHRRLASPLMSRALLPTFQHYIALSEGHRDFLTGAQGLDSKKTTVIVNGIDLDEVDRRIDRATDSFFRAQPPVVAVIAGLRRWKGHDILLEVVPTVLERFPTATFVLAGDGPERGVLERLSASKGVEQRVKFLGNIDDVFAVLAIADVAVLPSRTEAFPLSVLEAMAAGTPVVASAVGGVKEMIKHEITGLLVEPLDTSQLAEAIMRILADRELATRIVSNARTYVRKEHDISRTAVEYQRAFLSWIGRKA